MRSFRRILIRNDRCPYKEGRSGQRPTQVEDHVKTPGNEPSGGEGEMPPKTPNLPTPWSQTPGIQNCEGINVCCLNLLSCGRLQQTNTLPDQKTQTGRKNLKKRVRLYAQLYAIYKRVTLAQRTRRSWTWRVAKPTELDGREVTAGSCGERPGELPCTGTEFQEGKTELFWYGWCCCIQDNVNILNATRTEWWNVTSMFPVLDHCVCTFRRTTDLQLVSKPMSVSQTVLHFHCHPLGPRLYHMWGRGSQGGGCGLLAGL